MSSNSRIFFIGCVAYMMCSAANAGNNEVTLRCKLTDGSDLLYEIEHDRIVSNGSRTDAAKNIALSSNYISWEEIYPSFGSISYIKIDRVSGDINYRNVFSTSPYEKTVTGKCEKVEQRPTKF